MFMQATEARVLRLHGNRHQFTSACSTSVDDDHAHIGRVANAIHLPSHCRIGGRVTYKHAAAITCSRIIKSGM